MFLSAASGALVGQTSLFAFDGEIGGRVLLSYDPSLFPALDAAVSDLALLLRLRAPGGWAFYTRASLSDDQFTFLALGVEGRLGPVDSRAQAVFDPSADASGRFRYLSWLLSWRIGTLRFGNTLFLSGDPAHSYDQIGVRASVAGMTWNGSVRFRIETCDSPTSTQLPLAFDAAQIRVDALLFECGIPAQAKLSMSKTGFDALDVFVRSIPLSLLSTPFLETTLDLHVRFDTAGKEIEPTLQTLVGSVCAGVQPYIEFVDDGFPLIDGIAVYGIEFSCAIDEATEISSATCFDVDDPTTDADNYDVAAHNRDVTGESLYFERLSLSSLVPGCCGLSTEWGLDLYFEHDAPSLFDWGRVDGGVFFPLGATLFGSLEIEFTRTGTWLVYAGLSARF